MEFKDIEKYLKDALDAKPVTHHFIDYPDILVTSKDKEYYDELAELTAMHMEVRRQFLKDMQMKENKTNSFSKEFMYNNFDKFYDNEYV